jgi:hypothetical protein
MRGNGALWRGDGWGAVKEKWRTGEKIAEIAEMKG